MTDNTIDLFSKKKLSEVEAEKKEWQHQEEEAFKIRVQAILDQYQGMLDDGVLEGVSFLGVTNGGVVSPKAVYKTTEALHMLQFNLKEAEIGLHDYIADCYGLRDFEYFEED